MMRPCSRPLRSTARRRRDLGRSAGNGDDAVLPQVRRTSCEVARAERSMSSTPPSRIEEMAEQIGTGAGALQLGDLVGLDHAARHEEAVAHRSGRCRRTAAMPCARERTRRQCRTAASARLGRRPNWRTRAPAANRLPRRCARPGGESHRTGWRRISGSVRQAATRIAHPALGVCGNCSTTAASVRPWPTPITLCLAALEDLAQEAAPLRGRAP